MANILATFIVTIAYLAWGIWLLDRDHKLDDLDVYDLLAIIPVAIASWVALYLVGA